MKEKRIYSVVGVSFENRQEILSKFFNEEYKLGMDVNCNFILENDNQYDKNAVAVMMQTKDGFQKIGYIAKTENMEIRKNFSDIYSIKLASMGPNYKGIIGVSIAVEFSYDINFE